MNRKYVIAVTLGLCCWTVPATTYASKADGPKAKFFAKYDKNHNGIIDEDEKEAIRKDYSANPEGDLKRFDKNKDGKLDDEEIAAIKPPSGKGKAGSPAVSDFFAKYDKNHNGTIDADEKDAIRKDYAANPNGDLQKFDKNRDGKLDDDELAAIKLPTARKGGRKSEGAAGTEKTAVTEKVDKKDSPSGSAQHTPQ